MPSLSKLLPALALFSVVQGKKLDTSRPISTDTKAGKSLLSKALRTDTHPIEGGKPRALRQLEIENMGGMYIKYIGCSDFLQYGDYDWYQTAYNGNQGQAQQYQYNGNGGAQGGQYNYNGQAGQQNGQYQQQQNGQQQQQGQNGEQQQQGASGDQQGYYGEDGQWYQYNNGDQQQQEQQQQQQNYQQNYQQNQNYQGQNQMQQWEEEVYMAHLVRFTLCQNSGCGGCQGEYAVEMSEFVETYAEMGMNGDEYACEKVRESCYCYNNNNNREQCYYDCYQQAGYDGCMQYYGQAEFQLQEYIQCAEMEFYPNNYADAQNAAQNGGGYYYNEQAQNQNYRYWVGPYCSSNSEIYLGAFYDEQCMRPAGKSTFSADKYGSTFPYFFEPIIEQGKCISCMEPERQYENQQYENYQQYAQQYDNQVNYNNQQYEQNKNYNNYNYNQDENRNNGNYYNGNNRNYNQGGQQYQNGEQMEEQDYGNGNELCQRSMEQSIKCDYYHGYTYGCDYINNVLPSLDGRRSFEGMYNSLYNQLTRNKKAAIILGCTAAVMLGLVACMCGYMWTQDRSSIRIGLLTRRTDEELA